MRLQSTVQLTLAALFVVGIGGCFRALPKADPNATCDNNDQCPKGYVCNVSAHACCLPGDPSCAKSGDAALADAPWSTTGDVSLASDRGGGGAGSGGIGGGIADGGGAGGSTKVSPDATSNDDVPLADDASAKSATGVACSSDGQCASGHCVDGVCCATTCTGCNACSNALTGNFDGLCAPVLSGKVAHNACVDETATEQCGNDGTCDGNGACRKVGSSHVCVAASCSGDGKTFTPAATCDGNGACTEAVPQPCGVFQCAETGCLKTCTKTSDCDAGNYCNTSTGTCATTKPNGQTATRPEECTSGVIADGVCCNTACTGCSACTSTLNGQAANTTGQCLPVVASKSDPHGVCTAKPPCGQDGTCDGNGACHYPPAGAPCGTAACSESTLTTSACDSSHACAPTPGPCPNALACASPSACRTTCSADTDCAAGNYCAAGTCKPTLADGSVCSGNNQCQNGNCVTASGGGSGVCCHTACGTCNACSTGTCKPITNGTACGNGSVCNNGLCGSCPEGTACNPTTSDPCHTYAYSCATGTAVCQVSGNRPNTTACGPAQSCSGGTEYDQAYCSNGACPVQPTKACPSTGCGTTACNAPCSSSQTACGATCCDNATQYCSGTSCGTKAGNGQTCPVGNNSACQSNNCSSGLCCASGKSNSGGICCGSGQTNSNGVCCASGQTGCNGQCVNTSNDTSNCGSCGNVCPSGTNTCTNGTCSCGSHLGTCSAGTTCCGDNCYNLSSASSSFHCGTCSHSCLGDPCSGGACQPAPVSGSAASPFNYPPPYSYSGITAGGHTYTLGYAMAPNGDQDAAIFKDGSSTALCIWTTYSAVNEEDSFWGLVADNNFVYGLLMGGPLGVFKCPINGGTAVSLFEANASTSYGLVDSGTAIYWVQTSYATGTTQVYRLVK